MKKLFLAIAAVATLFATSCNKENTNAPEEPAVAADNEFVCVIDQNASQQNAPAVNDDMGTLAHIDGSNNIWWQVGDTIAYFGKHTVNGQPVANKGYYPLLCSKQSDNRAYFSAEGMHFYSGEHEAYYPASLIINSNNVLTLPSTITIDPNKNAWHLPMYGTGTGTHYLTFSNICAVLKITIPSFLNGATRFEISSDKAMNGAFTINNNNTAVMSATSPIDAEKKITVQKSSGNFATNETVYVAVPAQTYASLKIEFFNGAASIWTKTISNAPVAVSKVYPITLNAMNHQYVDLGLSVKWATCNIGAPDDNPLYHGQHISWASTDTRPDNEKYYYFGYGAYTSVNDWSYTKYNNTDHKTVLELCDDVAYVAWGNNWRMPTEAEFQELINNCTWTYTTYNTPYSTGYLITSNKPGYTNKSIFLPFGGYYNTPTGNDYGYLQADYWTSTVGNDKGGGRAFVGNNDKSTFGIYDLNRHQGLTIRPVCP